MYADVRVFIAKEEGGLVEQAKGGMDLLDQLEQGAFICRVEVWEGDVLRKSVMYRHDMPAKFVPVDADPGLAAGTVTKPLPLIAPGPARYMPPKILPCGTTTEIAYGSARAGGKQPWAWDVGLADALHDMQLACMRVGMWKRPLVMKGANLKTIKELNED